MGPLLALLLTFALMWVLLILPQQRRMRQHQAVIASLRTGDEVVTAGGVYGTIVSVDEDTLAVEVAPGVILRVLRTAVSHSESGAWRSENQVRKARIFPSSRDPSAAVYCIVSRCTRCVLPALALTALAACQPSSSRDRMDTAQACPVPHRIQTDPTKCGPAGTAA